MPEQDRNFMQQLKATKMLFIKAKLKTEKSINYLITLFQQFELILINLYFVINFIPKLKKKFPHN